MLKLRPGLAIVGGVADVLTTAAGATEHHQSPVLERHDAWLLHDLSPAPWFLPLALVAAAAPGLSELVGQITHHLTRAIPRWLFGRRMQGHRQHQTTAGKRSTTHPTVA